MNIKEVVLGLIFALIMIMTIFDKVFENFTLEFWHIIMVLVLIGSYKFYQIYKDY